MKLHSVIDACLIRGTASDEKGKSVRIQANEDETVLLFRTDTDAARQYLGISKASDLLYFYMRNQQTPKLVFVELKGSDLKKAADQLSVTIKAVRGVLQKRVGTAAQSVRVEAVVVFSGSTPKSLDDLQRQFRGSTGVSLRTHRETLDIRHYVTN